MATQPARKATADRRLALIQWNRARRKLTRSLRRAIEPGRFVQLLTQELLQLHDRAVGAQSVVDRVAVGVVLAMLIVILKIVNGRRIGSSGVLVDCERGHAELLLLAS